MEINFEVTKEDYIRFNIYHMKNSQVHNKSLNLLESVIGVSCFLGICSIFVASFFKPLSSIYWIIGGLLIFIFLINTGKNQCGPITEKLMAKLMEKFINEGDNSELFGKKNMIIDDEAITIYNKSSSEKISKNAIKNIKIYDDMIIIYTSSITANIIPTRYLDNNLKDDFIRKVTNMQLNI